MIDPHLAGRLDFVHRPPSREALGPGLHELGLFDERDAVLLVPESVDPRRPAPLMTLFHGGGGSAQKILPMMRDHAQSRGFLLLVPQSLFPTWDLVIGGNGPDRERLDRALAEVSSRFFVDPRRFAFAGHSDGGSYTLSLGPTNGHLVTHMIVSSAGFMSVFLQTGAPKVFISHGTKDEQIPIERSGRVHSAKLSEAGYDVTYVEYDGPHAWRPEIAQRSVDFFLG
ncbi:alpha/beta hydrolase [Chenggangzhangella methanolivorans]|uniref:Esterase n=1 Tax=Chenggangzhangella methanolivorans TaxID=1437009 RepID=A0A9E6UHL5_9HYPH|nr:esterase [Chenggangzhangella methanolivorans]QZN99897.1 esterase [Chenggangzhangella methanolivorans]